MNLRAVRGFSIIEFMIAITLSLVVLAALSTAFVGSSRSREEIERANQQVENGRYAVQVMTDDLEHAGYMSYLDQYCATCTGNNLYLMTGTTFPDPCATAVTTLRTSMPFHVQGYDGGASPALTCVPGVKAGTDIIVIRRASTCAAGTTNCALMSGAPYFQASTCNSGTELASTTTYDPTDDTTLTRYKLDTDQTKLTLHKKDCTTTADKLRYLVHIYFIASNDQGTDGIPTLKVAELDMNQNASCPARDASNNWCIMPIAEGVEDMEIEYGVDYTAPSPLITDGAPDVYTADPSRYNSSTPGTLAADCASNAKCVQNWLNVMSVRLNLLVRSTTKSKSFVDAKTYTLGLQANGQPQAFAVPTADKAYRRHVYESSIWLTNPAGRRQS